MNFRNDFERTSADLGWGEDTEREVLLDIIEDLIQKGKVNSEELFEILNRKTPNIDNEFDESMDGDHESALESAYGPCENNDIDRYDDSDRYDSDLWNEQ